MLSSGSFSLAQFQIQQCVSHCGPDSQGTAFLPFSLKESLYQEILTMDLKDKLVQAPPREKSGSVTAHRYDFQKNWALCKLLECHEAGENYLLVFDYHDDILLLDSESDPKTISFYQIKTKDDGHWTMTDILRRPKGKDVQLMSHLAKLYHNKVNYPGETKSLNFVSNARFSFSLKPSVVPNQSLSKANICASEIHEDELAKISSQLIEEHSLAEAPTFEDITFFIATDLSLPDHEIHTKGKLNEFLEHLFSHRRFQLSTIYRTIFDEVRRKNNHSEQPSTFEELVEKKSIGKTRFENMLKSLGVKTDLDEAWEMIEARLHIEALRFQTLVKIKQDWKRYEIERMDATNLTIQALRSAVKAALATIDDGSSLTGMVDKAFNQIHTTPAFTKALRRDEYLKAIILMEHYERQNLPEQLQLPETDPES